MLNNNKVSNLVDEDICLRLVWFNVLIIGLVLDLFKVDGDVDVLNICFVVIGVLWLGEVVVYRLMFSMGFFLDRMV